MDYKKKYLKYKNKYLKLKGSGNILSIIIDEIEFTLIAKNTKNERTSILILSKKDDIINNFLVYKSHSEVGVWRFYSVTYLENSIRIYKGKDYITETFINNNLQKFIYENFHLIPEVDKVVTNKDIFNCMFLSNIIRDKKLAIKILEKSHIIKEEKIIVLNTKFNLILKKEIFTMHQNFVPLLTEIYENKEKRYKSYDYFKILQFIECGSTDKIYKPFIKQLYTESIKTSNKVMKKTIEEIVPDIETSTKKPKNQISKYYQILNLYLKNIGLVYDESTIKFLYAYKTNFPKDNSPEDIGFEIDNIFIINVYSINISVNEDKFILYFIKYRYTRIEKGETIIREYNSILNIVPITNKITLYGLNSEILSIGVYICKLSDYHKQLFIDNIEDEEEYYKRILNSQYGFVGDYIHNIYPISEFYTKLPAIIEVEEKINTTDKYITEIDIEYLKHLNDNFSIYNNELYFIEPWIELPEKFSEIKIDFTEKKFTDIYEKMKENIPFKENDNISTLKSYIDVPFTYTNIELLLWINYYVKFDIKKFNIMTINFLVTKKIIDEINEEFIRELV